MSGSATSSRAFEDFHSGTRLVSASCLITAEAIIGFARKFDPQLFHLDPARAKRTLFGGLTASGWHTAAVSMRLFVETMNAPGGIIGLGVEDLKWPKAVRPGDELHVEVEILSTRISKSRPGYGIIHLRIVQANIRILAKLKYLNEVSFKGVAARLLGSRSVGEEKCYLPSSFIIASG